MKKINFQTEYDIPKITFKKAILIWLCLFIVLVISYVLKEMLGQDYVLLICIITSILGGLLLSFIQKTKIRQWIIFFLLYTFLIFSIMMTFYMKG